MDATPLPDPAVAAADPDVVDAEVQIVLGPEPARGPPAKKPRFAGWSSWLVKKPDPKTAQSAQIAPTPAPMPHVNTETTLVVYVAPKTTVLEAKTKLERYLEPDFDVTQSKHLKTFLDNIKPLPSGHLSWTPKGFQMASLSTFATDFVTAQIDGLNARFSSKNLDILNFYRIFNPSMYSTKMSDADLQAFGVPSFKRLIKHFFSGTVVPGSMFSDRGIDDVLYREFEIVKKLLHEYRSMYATAPSMLN